MGQDPNQPYPGQYGQPGGVPPQSYQGGYQQQGGYPPPPQPIYPPPPNTGYQYQQPYGQPGQYNVGHPNGPTSSSMDPNTASGLSYLAGWITGLIFFLMEKQNRFVRFNAMQSIVLSVATSIAYIVCYTMLSVTVFLYPLSCLFGLVIFAIAVGHLVFWIICMVNAFQGKYYKIPVIGDYAERWANQGTGIPPFYG